MAPHPIPQSVRMAAIKAVSLKTRAREVVLLKEEMKNTMTFYENDIAALSSAISAAEGSELVTAFDRGCISLLKVRQYQTLKHLVSCCTSFKPYIDTPDITALITPIQLEKLGREDEVETEENEIENEMTGEDREEDEDINEEEEEEGEEDETEEEILYGMKGEELELEAEGYEHEAEGYEQQYQGAEGYEQEEEEYKMKEKDTIERRNILDKDIEEGQLEEEDKMKHDKPVEPELATHRGKRSTRKICEQKIRSRGSTFEPSVAPVLACSSFEPEAETNQCSEDEDEERYIQALHNRLRREEFLKEFSQMLLPTILHTWYSFYLQAQNKPNDGATEEEELFTQLAKKSKHARMHYYDVL